MQHGNTPLIIGAKQGEYDIVDVLLKAGAKVDHKNKVVNHTSVLVTCMIDFNYFDVTITACVLVQILVSIKLASVHEYRSNGPMRLFFGYAHSMPTTLCIASIQHVHDILVTSFNAEQRQGH